MQIRNALPRDRDIVLDFCKDTFSWGDYIDGVWDYWISEGSLLVIIENNKPVGICHSLILKEPNQLWVEGIRIDKNYRRRGYAKKLVEAAELTAHSNVNCSKMLIEVSNSPSLNLAKKLDYKIESQWNFYSIQPERINLNSKLKFAKYDPQIFDFMKQYGMYYVRSWRWILINSANTSELFSQNKIILTENDGRLNALAVIIQSDHFEKTILVTLINGKDDCGIPEIISQIQNLAHEMNCEHIQILTRNTLSPQIDTKRKYSFYLVDKKFKQN